MSNKSPQELREKLACINGYCYHDSKDCPIYESMCYRDEIDHEHKENFEKMLDAMVDAITSHMQAGFTTEQVKRAYLKAGVMSSFDQMIEQLTKELNAEWLLGSKREVKIVSKTDLGIKVIEELRIILEEFRHFQADNNEPYSFDLLGFMEWLDAEKGISTLTWLDGPMKGKE